MTDQDHPEFITMDGERVELEAVLQDYSRLRQENSQLKKRDRKAVKRYRRQLELRPHQAELIRMQQFLEDADRAHDRPS